MWHIWWNQVTVFLFKISILHLFLSEFGHSSHRGKTVKMSVRSQSLFDRSKASLFSWMKYIFSWVHTLSIRFLWELLVQDPNSDIQISSGPLMFFPAYKGTVVIIKLHLHIENQWAPQQSSVYLLSLWLNYPTLTYK